MDFAQAVNLSPEAIRLAIRERRWKGPTAGLARGYAQANLVALPKSLAFDFLLFAQRNPKPAPVLDVTDPGDPVPRRVAPSADLRTDLPRYRIYKNGELWDEVEDATPYWRSDLVAFLLGCSFTFEGALLDQGLPVRHLEEGRNVPMYITNLPTVPAGIFSGPLVVTMRPFAPHQVVRAVQVTSRFPSVHGAPVHIGDPAAIGIIDLAKPDFGEAVTVRGGEIPVFWACGVTTQAVIMKVKPEFVITHAPGHMFITDVRDNELAVF